MKRRNFLASLSTLLSTPLLSGAASESSPAADRNSAAELMRGGWEQMVLGGVSGKGLVVDVGLPRRFVSWEKAQYVPCWEIEREKIWLYTEWLETGGTLARQAGSFEPMSDQENRFTHSVITEVGPARIQLRWRYTLYSHKSGRIFHGNTWAEEFYTIYPDGLTVRKLVAYPGNQEPIEGAPVVWEAAEVGLIAGAGNTLEDMLNLASPYRVGNGSGQWYPMVWPTEGNHFKYGQTSGYLCERAPQSKDWSTFVVRVGIHNRPQPFLIVPGRKDYFPRLPCPVCGNNHPLFLLRTSPGFNRYWPGCVGDSCPQPYKIKEEETHPLPMGHMALLSVIPWVTPGWIKHDFSNTRFDPAWSPKPGTSWLMLHGISDRDDAYIEAVARQWNTPPDVKMTEGTYSGFDAEENLFRIAPGRGGASLRIAASSQSPLIHPTFKLMDWSYRPMRVVVDGTPLPADSWRGSWLAGDLVVWVNKEFVAPVEIRLESY